VHVYIHKSECSYIYKYTASILRLIDSDSVGLKLCAPSVLKIN
jgi:hypothetical protein